MPFKSEKQRRYMHAKLPEIAKRWERDYAGGGIARLGFYNGNTVAPVPPLNDLGNPLNDPRIVSEERGLLGHAYPTNTPTNMLGDQYNIPRNKMIHPDNMSGALAAPYGVNPITGMPYQTPRTIADQNKYLGQTFTKQQPAWYNRMFNKAGQGITGLKNQMGNIFSGGKNLAGNLMGMAMGIPGLGALLGNIRPDTPYEKFQKQMFSDMGWRGGDPNKDPFGKNIRSLFGEYDVREQFDDLAGSKIGQKYGYAEAMKDGVLTDEEIEAMQDIDPVTGKPRGLKGWQLNRFKALFEAKKRADKYHKDVAKKAKEERMAKERERQAQMARSNRVVLDRPKGPRGDGGGSWHEQTAAKEKAGVQVAGPGFGKGAYFNQGGLASLWPK